MADEWPMIRSRRITQVSPWVALIERDIQFAPGAALEKYHAVLQSDYVAIVAVAPDGRLPLVRQFRPAVERFTWELPAGLVEDGEDPSAVCRRESARRDWVPGAVDHPARDDLAVHRPVEQQNPLLLCRDGRAGSRFRPGAGPDGKARNIGRAPADDHRGRIHIATTPWSTTAGPASFVSQPRFGVSNRRG